jgi:hypothetical protein
MNPGAARVVDVRKGSRGPKRRSCTSRCDAGVMAGAGMVRGQDRVKSVPQGVAALDLDQRRRREATIPPRASIAIAEGAGTMVYS